MEDMVLVGEEHVLDLEGWEFETHWFGTIGYPHRGLPIHMYASIVLWTFLGEGVLSRGYVSK